MARYTEKMLKERLLSKAKPNPETGCWEWTASNTSDGYGQFWDGETTKRAHRISYEIHCGPIPDDLQILHRCDNPICINPKHLFPGTNADNMADKVAKGRQPHVRGTQNGNAKLSETDVIAIRTITGISQSKIAAQYGVTQALISYIRLGKGWSHI